MMVEKVTPVDAAVDAALASADPQGTLYLLERTALHARNYAQVRFSSARLAPLNALLDIAQNDPLAFEQTMDRLADRMSAAGSEVVRHKSTYRSNEYQADRVRFQRRLAAAQLRLNEEAGATVTTGLERKAEVQKVRKQLGDELRARLDTAREGGRIKQLDRMRIHKEFWDEVEERLRGALGRYADSDEGEADE